MKNLLRVKKVSYLGTFHPKGFGSKSSSGFEMVEFLIGNIPDHETAEILITNNVDINAIDNFGMTPLDWTKGRNGEKGAIAKTLLEHGAKTAEELKS